MNIKGSWRTTTASIAAIGVIALGAVKALADNDPSTNPDWNLVVAQVLAAVGLLHARDNKVSSEGAGIK